MTGSVSCWFNYIYLIRISLHSVVFNIISTNLKPPTIAIQTAAWSSMEPAEFQFSLAVYESKMWPWAYKILWIALCQSYPCSTKMTFFLNWFFFHEFLISISFYYFFFQLTCLRGFAHTSSFALYFLCIGSVYSCFFQTCWSISHSLHAGRTVNNYRREEREIGRVWLGAGHGSHGLNIWTWVTITIRTNASTACN